MRNAWLQDHIPVKVGLMAACPDGSGFNAKFEYCLLYTSDAADD